MVSIKKKYLSTTRKKKSVLRYLIKECYKLFSDNNSFTCMYYNFSKDKNKCELTDRMSARVVDKNLFKVWTANRQNNFMTLK